MGILEQHRRGRLLVAGLIAFGLAGAGLSLWWHAHRAEPGTEAARPIPGVRIHLQVEVVNATAAVGLARAATRLLRDAGIDVVAFGSDTGPAPDSTQVLVRRGTGAGADLIVRALGVGRGAVRNAPDPGRLVDVTVRLGRDFAARLAARHP
jgi:LytR cell envelope-related transcriptional attenuator